MRSTFNLMIDVRRHFACGIGRVSLNFAEAAVARRERWNRLILLTNSGNRARVEALADDDTEVLIAGYPFFSRADLCELPRLVERAGADVFVAPQFYISPWIECPTVKMVHDLWPIQHDHWLPTTAELTGHFGAEAAEGVTDFLQWFDRNHDALPSWRNDRLRELYELDDNPVRRYSIAMFCTSIDTAASIPTCSWFSRDEITDLFPLAEPRMDVIYPFLQPREVLPKSRRFAFLHVGKFEPRKNHRLVVEAFMRAYDRLSAEDREEASLTLIGDVSYRQYGREIVEMVRDAARDYPIHFLGVTSEAELWRHYAAAYALVFPSAFEGFGIPVVEAMSAGTPVITANRGGTREAAGGAALLVDELEPDPLAEAMLALWRDGALYQSLREQGTRHAAAFTRTRSSMQFEMAIDRAAGCDDR
jgi:glycosyltransferase involved in cell wall biosynthesis